MMNTTLWSDMLSGSDVMYTMNPVNDDAIQVHIFTAFAYQHFVFAPRSSFSAYTPRATPNRPSYQDHTRWLIFSCQPSFSF
jgi:hypothetical protein